MPSECKECWKVYTKTSQTSFSSKKVTAEKDLRKEANGERTSAKSALIGDVKYVLCTLGFVFILVLKHTYTKLANIRILVCS